MKSAERLVRVVQQLSLARSLDRVMEIVRTAARELTGADGATFVLRDHGKCFYADEDAVGPLWKGLRFPLETCISGWAMLNRQAVAIEDIYQDPRIPHDAYRPTFVKSLAMVPIRAQDPIGAIGNYWASHHQATTGELQLLQALADSTSIAIENVNLYADLENRVHERTTQLELANAELAAFAARVSHDLRAPLRSIQRFATAVIEDAGPALDSQSRSFLHRIDGSAGKAFDLIENLLQLARVDRGELRRAEVDVSGLAREIAGELAERDAPRVVDVEIHDGIVAHADGGLVRIVLENLLGNAWKFTARSARAHVAVSPLADAPGFSVVDNGAGFDPTRAGQLFQPFTRLHTDREFAGTGIGLATVHRIVERHGGRVWADAAIGRGASFHVVL